MKRFLLLVSIVAGLAVLGSPAAESAVSCETPSFNAAQAFKLGNNCCGNDVQGIAVGDLNNDGRPDVVSANGVSDSVSVVLGGGQSFLPAVNFPSGGIRAFSVAVGDFNEDGKADVVASNIVNSDNLSILLGDGAGGLTLSTQLTGVADPLFVLTADFNGDGNLDLGAADTTSVKIFLGNGAGNFSPANSFGAGSTPRALAAADFNLDGKLDLAVANRGGNNVSILLGNGAGGFVQTATPAVGLQPEHLAVADFNSDGRGDLAVANAGSAAVSVLLGMGDGRFGPVTNLSAGSPVNSVAVGDFNNDGNADFAAGTLAAGVSVRLGNGAGGFAAARSFRPGSGPLFLAVTDFNRDGSEDILAASSASSSLIPLAGDGAGNFAVTPSLTTGTNALSTALADFNGDGRLDSVYANENANSVSVRFGTGTGTFGDAANFAAGQRPFWVSVGDFNNDNRPDLVTANFLAGLSVLINDGAGGFAAPVALGLGSPPFNPTFVAVADVNNDGKADLLGVRQNVFAVTVLLGNGAGGFGSPTNFSTAPNPRAVAVGDFNGDNKLDLAVSDNSFSILLGDGAGGFAPPLNTNFNTNTGPNAIVARDFNGDNKLDLAIANEFTNDVSVLLGDGTGKFAPRVNFFVGVRPVSLHAADFNGDGLQDLAAANFTSQNLAVLLGNGAGGFGPATFWSLPASPNSIAVNDLNGDGRFDITAVGSNALAVLLNSCGDAQAEPAVRLSVDDVTVNEPDAGSVNAVFTVSLSAPSATAVTLKFVASGLSAERGRDFQTVSGALTFAPGVTTQTVSVPVSGDATDEFDELFSLNIFEPTNALITKRRGTGTIADNDAEPMLSIGNVSAPEGQTNNVFSLPVTLSQASGKLVTVVFNTADGTAAAGPDYAGGAGTVTLPAGATSGTAGVTVVGDAVGEPDETFFVDLSSPFNASVAVARGAATIIDDDTAKVQFGAASFSADEGGVVNINVTRTGNTSGESFVNYATISGTANDRQDYTAALGTLRFGPGQTQQSFAVIITDDRFNDDGESFTVRLTSPSGADLGTQAEVPVTVGDNDAADGPTPVKAESFDAEFFVRQHYHDFFSRQPDAPGLAHWIGVVSGCAPTEPCGEVLRINVSGAFFLSIEFNETGYLVERTYKAAYGDATGTSTLNGPHTLTVPIIRLEEFLPDTQRIGRNVVVNQGDWQAQLEANKRAYFLEFVQRQRFIDSFPLSLSPVDFVDRLNGRAGGPLDASERQALIDELTANNTTAGRASVLRKVAEDATLFAAERNRAFVLMQYFGYLRRDPNSGPDIDYTGYDFWLGNLNRFGGNFVEAELVKAFISSVEYQQRFGQ